MEGEVATVTASDTWIITGSEASMLTDVTLSAVRTPSFLQGFVVVWG